MGNKKRDYSDVAELEEQTDSPVEKTNLLSSKNSKKTNEDGEVEERNESVSTTSSSIKPMERRKKRKALDKERHQTGSDNREKLEIQLIDEGLKSNVTGASLTSSSSGLGHPQLHMSVFTDLASADMSIRQAAAKTLLIELEGAQNEYEKNEGDEEGLQLEAEKDDGLKDCARSLRYAVRRLIRGVSSSRECARQGFALGLTVVLSKFPCIKVEPLIKLITDLLEVSSSMKGQEVRDCLLGRLFAYGAFVRSGRITLEWISDKKSPYVKEFTSLLISLSAKKRYLQEPAVAVVLEMVEKLPAEALLNQVLDARGLREWFKEATDIGNPDALLLALKLRQKIGKDNEVFEKLLPCPFSPSKMFANDHLTSLIPCFKESTFCQPRVHGIWPALINILLPGLVTKEEDAVVGMNSSKKHKKSRKFNSEEDIAENLRSFCEVVIEGCLLMSSHDRKHLAFDILLLILPRLAASCVHIAISHKLVHGVMDILSTKDSWLYKAAQHFLLEVVDWVKNDDDRRVAVILALQKHSSGRFDSVTRTKTVRDLVGGFSTETGCMLFVQNLVNMFLDDRNVAEEPSDQSQTTDENSEMGSQEDKDSLVPIGSPDFLKSWVIDSLPRVLKDIKLTAEAHFRVQKEIMKFLAVQGLFSASLGTEVTSFELQEKFIWPKAATSRALCHMCIEQLQLLLANAQKSEELPSNVLEPNDLGSYFIRFLGTFCNIPSVSLFRTLSNADEKAFKKLLAMEARLAREERNMGPGVVANKLHAMRYLLIQLLLQVLLRPEEFHEAASELIICCKKAFPSPDLLDSSSDDDETDDGGAPELMDVLVDTMLSLLPQSSSPMRSAVEQVFKYFCGSITNAGLLRMLRVIKKDLKPARHQAMGNDGEDEAEDEDDEDLLDIDETEETDDIGPAETGESDDEAGDSDATAGAETDQELPEVSDESDEEMDDDAMFRMDSYLTQIFKEKKNASGGETAQSQLVLFKLRVLSLLEIYLHENPGNPHVLTVYSYLAQALVNPNTVEGSEQLGQRIWGILQKKVLKHKEYPKGEDVQVPTLESLLRRNLKLASRPFKKKKSVANMSKKKQMASVTRQKVIASLAHQSTHWIVKMIRARDLSEPELQKFLDIFKHVLSNYFNSKKSQLKPAFIKEVFQRQPWIGHKLFHFLVDKCGTAKYEFRRISALELVEGLLKSLVSGKADDDKNVTLKKLLKAHMSLLTDLIWKLVVNMPKKQSWRAQVRRFCGQIFKLITMQNLMKEFLKALNKEAYDACSSQLGDLFLPFKKPSAP